MKKSLIALAVLAASGAAMAQSSVTLYGVADAFIGAKKLGTAGTAGNQLTTTRLTQNVIDSNGLNSSRWGLRGIEDLGGGMKGVFVLESQVDISTGAASTPLFNRQAFVGLDSNFGTVTLGRQYSAYDSVRGTFLSAQGNSTNFDATNGVQFSQANVAALTAFVNTAPAARTAAQATAAAAALNVNNAGVNRIGAWVGYQTRVDNSIRYATPNISGFQAALVYGFGENKTATTSATKNISGSLTYANGPIGVALVHANDETAPGFHVKNTAIGGSYDFGVAKPFLSFNQAKYDGLAKQNEFAVGLRAPIGAATLVAQYARSKGDFFGKVQSVGLEGQYSLSKRTTAYAAFNQTKVQVLADNKNTVFGLGVRHTF
jgi:predicted porin